MGEGTAMSDELENENKPEDQVNEEPQGDLDSTDWKAEARKWEKRAKENLSLKDDAEKWQQYEKSLKPEQERLAEELQATKHDAEAAKLALMRYEVAAEKNIPGDAIKLLQGSTREELDEAADALLALIANTSKPKSPRPDNSQGTPTTGGGSVQDQFASAIDDIL